jgi:hypothetical protein
MSQVVLGLRGIERILGFFTSTLHQLIRVLIAVSELVIYVGLGVFQSLSEILSILKVLAKLLTILFLQFYLLLAQLLLRKCLSAHHHHLLLLIFRSWIHNPSIVSLVVFALRLPN